MSSLCFPASHNRKATSAQMKRRLLIPFASRLP
jgi:hypothetical protein